MISPGQKYFWMVAGIGCGLAVASPAQNSREVLSIPQTPPAARQVMSKSPVDLFRELLNMPAAERTQVLAARPPEVQNRIREKLEEYQIMPLEIREWRLRETELRHYLLPLMEQPRAAREARLALIPEEPRRLLEERLATWDLLPPDLQKEFLNNEMIRGYFSQPDSRQGRDRWLQFVSRKSPGERAELEAGLERWRGFSEEQRRKTLEGFNNFFELTAEEKEKALNTLSDEERKQMETTLAFYTKLTPAQRTQCIHSFEKFTGMSPAERQQFLKNAERWKAMSPEERQAWRDLVATAPIMPGADTPRIPTYAPRRVPLMATN